MHDANLMGNMMDRGISIGRPEKGPAFLPLPLNLIAQIISYLDSPGDLGRMCRTCRVFHYMTLPQLYSHVSLRSYDLIRFRDRDGRPEGCGMASPFCMGLSGLATRNVAVYVKDFEVCGEWKEHELQEHSRVGRVTDGSMLMNSLVRVAVERMSALESFSWELNTKMLPTVWQCLAQKATLKKLTVKFPSSRDPCPLTLAPPIPSLEYLHIHDMDPLCYPDDISALLCGSKRLETLKLHWSSRMRDVCEPSIHPSAYFHRCAAAQYKLRLKSISLCNYFVSSIEMEDPLFEDSLIEEATSLNSTTGAGDDSGAGSFVEQQLYTPKSIKCILPRLRSIRTDKINHGNNDMLAQLIDLEKIYLVGPQARIKQHTNGLLTNGSISHPPFSRSPSNSSTPGSSDGRSLCGIKEAYLETITKKHGSRLQHLLLPPQWRLTDSDLARLVRMCPNLEQLALGTELAHLRNLELLLPFLNKLVAVRFLPNPDDSTFLDQMKAWDVDGTHARELSEQCALSEFKNLRWVDVGADDLIFEIGPLYVAGVDNNGADVMRRHVMKRTRSAVAHVAIWKMDSYDI